MVWVDAVAVVAVGDTFVAAPLGVGFSVLVPAVKQQLHSVALAVNKYRGCSVIHLARPREAAIVVAGNNIEGATNARHDLAHQALRDPGNSGGVVFSF